MNWKTHEFAWAAGFFDGEGHMQRKKYGPCLTVAQVDRSMLVRFRSAFGLPGGNIYKRSKRPGGLGIKPLYIYQVARRETVQQITACMWPWLSKPKRKQIRGAF